ncbi:hypothetical protein GCM10014715_69910 [Streptomyces spiralis]|uniref:Secreted protein n=1 Tax=Streptomyces spiralis TaxID=66376 RepID=A0A919E2B9_9ACTN|nr:hypothetical protein GCM10014715_69910 [Streptomyces spiralis]
MRPFRSVASATLAAGLGPLLLLPYGAWAAEPFGATCRSTVSGSEVTAYCHNPYPETDRVALHIECARWWDLDGDGAPVDVGPAQTVRMTGRCWKEIRAVWISHLRAD